MGRRRGIRKIRAENRRKRPPYQTVATRISRIVRYAIARGIHYATRRNYRRLAHPCTAKDPEEKKEISQHHSTFLMERCRRLGCGRPLNRDKDHPDRRPTSKRTVHDWNQAHEIVDPCFQEYS